MLTGQRYVDEVLHPHVLQSIGLLETIFSLSKTMPPIDLFASWSCHNPLTGLPDPDPSPIDHLLDIRDQPIHDLNPFLVKMSQQKINQNVYQTPHI